MMSSTSSASSKPSDNTQKGLCNSDSFNAEEFDISYRAALEVLRMGELEIILPDVVPLCYESLPQLPSSFKHKLIDPINKRKLKVHTQIQLQTQKEVSSRYDKLYKIASVLKKQSYINESPNTYPRLLCVKIFYTLPPCSRQGLVFRQNVKNSIANTTTSTNLNTTASSAAAENKNKDFACMYTVSKGTVGMRDPHGV